MTVVTAEQFDITYRAMVVRLIRGTVNDVKLTELGAREIVAAMSGHRSLDSSFNAKDPLKVEIALDKASTWSDIAYVDRAPRVLQSYLNFQHANHQHSPIANELSAIAYGGNNVQALLKELQPEFCDPHSSLKSEIEKCQLYFGVPCISQFVFGRYFRGKTVFIGEGLHDMRKVIAQDLSMIEPGGIKTVIISDRPEQFLLHGDRKPTIYKSFDAVPEDDAMVVYVSPKAAGSELMTKIKSIAGVTSVVWDTKEEIPLNLIGSGLVLSLFTNRATQIKRFKPDYFVVTETGDELKLSLFPQFEVLRWLTPDPRMQLYKGDVLFQIVHTSGKPYRAMGIPWFPEEVKNQNTPDNRKSFFSRLFKERV